MLYGCDSAFAPSADQAAQIYALGWRFWCGYLGGPRATHAWAPADFRTVADAGFSLLPPLYVGRTAPWDTADAFTAANGEADAADALRLMDACGFAAEAPVGLDAEYADWHTYPGPFDTYLRAFCAAINAAGRKVCVYSDTETLGQYGPEVIDLFWGASWQPGAFTQQPPLGSWNPQLPPPWDAWQYAGGTLAGVSVDVSSAVDAFPFAALGSSQPVRETPADWPWPTWQEAAVNYKDIADALGPERDALAAKIQAAEAALA